ncbi:MAG TPA: hypothetical protein VKH37_05790 [Ferruginibacter sp.]|nr:hypothetical protein [Ferruginibacter sp.]
MLSAPLSFGKPFFAFSCFEFFAGVDFPADFFGNIFSDPDFFVAVFFAGAFLDAFFVCDDLAADVLAAFDAAAAGSRRFFIVTFSGIEFFADDDFAADFFAAFDPALFRPLDFFVATLPAVDFLFVVDFCFVLAALLFFEAGLDFFAMRIFLTG